MQEQVEEKTVALSFKAGKLTGRALAKAMSATVRMMKHQYNKPRAGNQSFKRLTRTVGGETDSIQVMGRIRSFERFARKNGVSYRVEKDIGTKPPTWTVYFKAKQTADITSAFNAYSHSVLHRDQDKPSVLNTLRRFREKAKSQPDRVKNKERGGHEL